MAAALVGVAGCASGPKAAPAGASPQTGAERPTRSNSNTLATTDFKGLESLNLADAIQRLRPHWLRRSEAREQGRLPGAGRADPLAVWVDESRVGGVEVLNSLAVQGVSGVRYYSGPEAEARFGNGNASGAIHVVTANSGKRP
jgi:hypothetical protein